MSEKYDLYDLEFDREDEPEEDGIFLFSAREMERARKRALLF